MADGWEITPGNVGQREYYHLFPMAYLRDEMGVDESEASTALNCALITWRTNRTIGAKDPVGYLRERAEASSLGEEALRNRLESHAIPYEPELGRLWSVSEASSRALRKADSSAVENGRSGTHGNLTGKPKCNLLFYWPCSHLLDQPQGRQSVAQSAVVPSGQFLAAVAAPLGGLAHVGRVTPHDTLPWRQLSGKSSTRPEASHGRIPNPPIVGGVIDEDSSSPQHLQQVGVNLPERRRIGEGACGVAMDARGTGLYATAGPDGPFEECLCIRVHDRYLYELYRRFQASGLRV